MGVVAGVVAVESRCLNTIRHGPVSFTTTDPFSPATPNAVLTPWLISTEQNPVNLVKKRLAIFFGFLIDQDSHAAQQPATEELSGLINARNAGAGAGIELQLCFIWYTCGLSLRRQAKQ